MSNDADHAAAADFMLDLADRQGVSVSTVKDGTVFVFTKNHLERLLARIEKSGNDKCVVFVKRPDDATN